MSDFILEDKINVFSTTQEEGKEAYKNEKLLLFSSSSLINENIDRVWMFFLNINYFLTLNSVNVHNYKKLKEGNFYSPGNIQEMYWIGVANVLCKTIYSLDSPIKKMLVIACKLDIGLEYIKTVILYNITNNKKTLVKIIYSKAPYRKNKTSVYDPSSTPFYKELHSGLIKKYDNFIKNSKEYISSQISCIINESLENIKKFISDFNNLTKIKSFRKYFGTYFEYYLNEDMIEGNFIKFESNIYHKVVYLKVTKSFQNKYKFYFTLENFGSSKNIPKISITTIFIKLKEKQTFINVISDNISDLTKECCYQKIKFYKEILIELKNYIENSSNNNVTL